jgi:hypothetical protein
MFASSGLELVHDLFQISSVLDEIDIEWNREVKPKTKLLYVLHSEWARFRVPVILDAIELAKTFPDDLDLLWR